MKVGFTGTRIGMSNSQISQLKAFLEAYGEEDWFYHGGCHGADIQAASIAQNMEIKIKCFPGSEKQYEKNISNKIKQLVFPVKDFLKRNKLIVDKCDVLIAAPRSDEEELRSGTWSTIRYAKKVNKTVIILSR